MADQPDHRERRWRNGCRKRSDNDDERNLRPHGSLQQRAENCTRKRQRRNALQLSQPSRRRRHDSEHSQQLSDQADGGATIQNTANSYLISAPGYYRIPLVYGNAIHTTAASPTVGVDNQSAYKAGITGEYILTNFKDHDGVNITSPYINANRTVGNRAKKANIVWADHSGLVENLSVDWDEHGNGSKSFVKFKVSKEKICNANAVIALKNDAGTIMWSWHLWFDKADALDLIPCTNYQGVVYKFTKHNLGFVQIKKGSVYTQPRKARLKVEQAVRNGGSKEISYITITQNNGLEEVYQSTMYQFGRKDALPGTKSLAEGNFTPDAGDNMSIKNGIQNPDKLYVSGLTWIQSPANGGYTYQNLWSINNTTYAANDNAVIKTIYDPCPVGFHVPAPNAFTGFSSNGQQSGTPNTVGVWNNGWTFNNKLSSPDQTIFFPACGWRAYLTGGLFFAGSYYQTSGPWSVNICYQLFLFPAFSVFNNSWKSGGVCVRPVAE